MDFHRVLQTLGRSFDTQNTRYGVIGGVALAAYGIARMTVDLDLVIAGEAQDSVVDLLEALGYETLHCSPGYSNHRHAETALGRVDIVYVRGQTCRELFAASQRVDGPGGLDILVPSPEHLAAMKVVAMKNDPDRVWQDLADIRHLMQLPGVDRQAIRASFEKYGLAERYLELEKSL